MGIRGRYAGPYKNREKAERVLEDMWSNGDVGPLEAPQIDVIRNHRGKIIGYAISTLY